MNMPKGLGIAVPKYMKDKASKSKLPPGHRFNLYAPMWVEEPIAPKEEKWSIGEDINNPKRSGGKTATLKMASEPYTADLEKLLNGVCERQVKNAVRSGAYIIPIKLTSPFAVGLGNASPVENGFSFLSPYGLPYIAGSGIKGVLRRAYQELELSVKDEEIALFGCEDTDNSSRGALSFWDGFPQCHNMTVEVKTPHQSDYYQGKSSPHDQGKPTPIPFLVVPATTKMNLVVQCDEYLLGNKVKNWREKVKAIVEYASKWLGFGAKTAVGYGSFEINTEELEKNQKAIEQQEEEKRLAFLSPEERAKEENIKILNSFVQDFEAIRSKEKTYNVSSSKLNAKLKDIYDICGKLRNDAAEKLLKDIFSFVKTNDKKKKEVKSKLLEFGFTI